MHPAAVSTVPTSRLRALNRIHPWQVVLGLTLAYTYIILALHAWSPMAFVNLVDRSTVTKPGQSLGYDGQFFYEIAKDPLNAWQVVDVAAYRYQRILYPLLAAVLSLGQVAWIPWTLLLINLIAIPLGTYLMEITLVYQRVSRWYALIYGLSIGTMISLRLDVAEPLAFLLVQAALLAILRQKPWQGALWFALASLTRETTLLFAGGYVLYLIFQKKFLQAALWSLGTGALFILWHVVLKIWLGSWGIGAGGALATPLEVIPYHGWWGVAATNLSIFALISTIVFPLAILPSLLSLGASAWALIHRIWTPVVWVLFLNAALFAFLPQSNIFEPIGLSRVTLGLVVAVLNFGAERQSKRTLNYAWLWLIFLVFLYKDSFLPFG
jgi:hypothetical protein